MNYFGHAVMAHTFRPEPAFVLGAMLPDLLHLSEEPLGALEDPALEEGMLFHQRTDGIFHGSPTFVAWCHDALDAARRAGVSKGPARGMTHLVVELIIDAQLAVVPRWQDAYMAALESRPPAIAERARLAEGLDWLLSRGPSLHNSSRQRLSLALATTLRRRPRLSPSEEELETALSVWAELPARVQKELPALLRDLAPLFADAKPESPHLNAEISARSSALWPPEKDV